jgi:hypothetical protein
LERAGAKLSKLVTMTVFITDDRYGRQFLGAVRGFSDIIFQQAR